MFLWCMARSEVISSDDVDGDAVDITGREEVDDGNDDEDSEF